MKIHVHSITLTRNQRIIRGKAPPPSLPVYRQCLSFEPYFVKFLEYFSLNIQCIYGYLPTYIGLSILTLTSVDRGRIFLPPPSVNLFGLP